MLENAKNPPKNQAPQISQIWRYLEKNGRRKSYDPSKFAEKSTYRGCSQITLPSDHRKSLIKPN